MKMTGYIIKLKGKPLKKFLEDIQTYRGDLIVSFIKDQTLINYEQIEVQLEFKEGTYDRTRTN